MEMVDLAAYDRIVISNSAGKDSQAMLDYVGELAAAVGVLNRVVVVHCDLGRVEWKGTPALAKAQAGRYGIRFAAVSRRQGGLLEQVKARGMWPSPKQRYCTSNQKRAQVHRVYTAMSDEVRRNKRGVARILSCQGHRAQESTFRAKRVPFERDTRASNGRRHVDLWLPIHNWTVDTVWARIKAGRTPDLVHPAYGFGMPRLSCVFCIFAPKAALVLAGRHNPELLAEYVDVEREIGHRFRVDLSLAEVQAEAQRCATVEAVDDWSM